MTKTKTIEIKWSFRRLLMLTAGVNAVMAAIAIALFS